MTPSLIIAIVGVFGTVAVAVGALMSLVLERNAPERRRLEKAGQATVTGVLLDNASLTPEATEFAKRMTSIVPRSPKDMSMLRRRFLRAGYQSLTPVAIYTLAQIVLPITFGLIPLMFMSLS